MIIDAGLQRKCYFLLWEVAVQSTNVIMKHALSCSEKRISHTYGTAILLKVSQYKPSTFGLQKSKQVCDMVGMYSTMANQTSADVW